MRNRKRWQHGLLFLIAILGLVVQTLAPAAQVFASGEPATTLPVSFDKAELTKDDGTALPEAPATLDQNQHVNLALQFSYPASETGYAAGASASVQLPTALAYPTASDGSATSTGTFGGSDDTAKWTLNANTGELTITLLKAETASQNLTLNMKDLQFKQLSNTDLTQKLDFATTPTPTSYNLQFVVKGEPVVAQSLAADAAVNPRTISGVTDFNGDGGNTGADGPKWSADASQRTANPDLAVTLAAQNAQGNAISSDLLAFTVDDLTKVVVTAAKLNADGSLSSSRKTLVQGQDYNVVAADNQLQIYLTNGIDTQTGYEVAYQATVQRANTGIGTLAGVRSTGTRYLTATGAGSDNTALAANKVLAVRNAGSMLAKQGELTAAGNAINWTIDWNYQQTPFKAGRTITDTFGIKTSATMPAATDSVKYAQGSFHAYQVVMDAQGNPMLVQKDGSSMLASKSDAVTNAVDYTNAFRVTKTSDNQMQIAYTGASDAPANAAFMLTYSTDLGALGKDATVRNVVQEDADTQYADVSTNSEADIYKASGTMDYVGQALDWQVVFNKQHREMNNAVMFDVFPAGLKSLATDRDADRYMSDDKVKGIEAATDLTKTEDGKNDGVLVMHSTADDDAKNNAYALIEGKDYELIKVPVTADASTNALTTATNEYLQRFPGESVVAQKTTNSGEYGFVIKLIGDYAHTTDRIWVNYRADLDQDQLDNITGSNSNLLANNAYFYYEPPKDQVAVAGGSSGSGARYDPALLTGVRKIGVSNTDGTQTWGILVNQRSLQYGLASLADTLPVADGAQFNFVPGSLQFYTADTNAAISNGWTDGRLIDQAQPAADDADLLPTNAADTWVTDGAAGSGQTLNLQFANLGNKRVWVVFKTQRETKWFYNSATVTNKVTVNDNETATTKIKGYSSQANVSAGQGMQAITKQGQADPNNTRTANWQVDLINANDAGRGMIKPVVTDTLTDNETGASVDASSIKVALQTGTSDFVTLNGTGTSPDYSVKIDGDQLTVQFNRDFGGLVTGVGAAINRYDVRITYNTLSAKSGTVANEAAVAWQSAAGAASADSDDLPLSTWRQAEAKVDLSIASGSIDSGSESLNATLKVHKQDVKTQKALAGATFTLERADGTGSPMQAVTDDQGNLQFAHLPAGLKYILTETAAPEGYTLTDTPSQKVFLNPAAGTDTQTVTVDNTQTPAVAGATRTLRIAKVDAQSKAKLMGAQFRLSAVDGSVPDRFGVTGQDGILNFVDLPSEKEYRLIEIKAPKGYELPKESAQTVTLADGKDAQVLTVQNTATPSGETTPPTTGGETTPPTTGTEVTPPTTGTEVTPPTTGTEITPPTTGTEVTPPTTGTEVTPPTTGTEVTPPTTGTEVTPPTTGTEVTPPTTGTEVTPPTTGTEVTLPPTGGETTPPTTDDKTPTVTKTPDTGSTRLPDTAGQVDKPKTHAAKNATHATAKAQSKRVLGQFGDQPAVLLSMLGAGLALVLSAGLWVWRKQH